MPRPPRRVGSKNWRHKQPRTIKPQQVVLVIERPKVEDENSTVFPALPKANIHKFDFESSKGFWSAPLMWRFGFCGKTFVRRCAFHCAVPRKTKAAEDLSPLRSTATEDGPHSKTRARAPDRSCVRGTSRSI